MRAALAAGADAVYFGLSQFNARARAANFAADELGSAMRLLHEHGARGYVTLNTLVFDHELDALEASVRACAGAAVDAVIVQDWGVAAMVRAVAPTLPIHASTQMTCTDAASVDLARSFGAARVILARELSLAEIAAIRNDTDVDLEVFVHGALCIAYSGQCLTSEAIGGRSANRGACAQACRLPYELVVDGARRDLGDRAYLLSPEDLEASALVPELVDLGVASLKIEGRLKGPAYVAAATELYRRAVDAAAAARGAGARAAAPSEAERTEALQMYSRGSGPGFLGGVDHQRLVEARTCDHRGTEVAAVTGAASRRADGKEVIAMRTSASLALGDGILIEGGFAGRGELGGRIWGLFARGVPVDAVRSGEDVLAWLGPDKQLAGTAGRPGARVFKTNDPKLEREMLRRAEQAPPRLAMDVTVSGKLGEPLAIEAAVRPRAAHASHEEARTAARAKVETDAPLVPARTAPLDRAALADKLGRLGETPFELGKLVVDLPEGATLPISSVNRARRALVAALLAESSRSHATTKMSHAELLSIESAPLANRASRIAADGPRLYVLCRKLEQAEAALDAGADGVYLDFLELTGTGSALRSLRQRKAPFVGVAPPRIRKPGEEKIDRYLASLEPDAILIRSLGMLHERREPGGPLRIGDFSLNVANHLSAAIALGLGLDHFTPSFDLDGAQLTRMLGPTFAPFAEVVLHHPMPLFHMEHCVIAALLSEGSDYRTCGRPCERHQLSLRDRAGMDHPVEADVGCRNTVFHAAPQSAADLVPALRAAGVQRFRIELVRETEADVRNIVESYRRLLTGDLDSPAVFRALRTRSGYGVVRGSLRVLSE
jgi:putative protease